MLMALEGFYEMIELRMPLAVLLLVQIGVGGYACPSSARAVLMGIVCLAFMV